MKHFCSRIDFGSNQSQSLNKVSISDDTSMRAFKILRLRSSDFEMAGNSELMDVIKNNVDNHHAKISDALYEKWIELNQNKRIESKETAFHLSVVIDLKTHISEYFEGSNLALSWQNTSVEDQNGICSILLMDFLIELAHAFHGKFSTT